MGDVYSPHMQNMCFQIKKAYVVRRTIGLYELVIMSLDRFKTNIEANRRGRNRNREYTDEEIIELYLSGLTQQEVADKSNIGQTQVHRILDKNDVEARPMCNSMDELELSDRPLYSYIVSVLSCDGSVFKSESDSWVQYIITLNAIDYEFVNHYADKAREFGFHVYTNEIEKSRENCKNQLVARSHHKEFYNHWESLSAKDKLSICTYNKKAKVQFLKGAYESEGSIWESPNLVLEISNEKDWIIKGIIESGKTLGFDFGTKSRKKTKSGYMEKAFLSDRTEVKRFIRTIEPCIKQTPRQS